ncbi:MAG: type II toxin-antitoxin system Phd/YefM family antitoxin [Sphingomonadales bacterium]|nr:type II toxin-antitoxin system Phd/YefM family antitoxin [Sphingomonadales bacterium]
MNKIVSASEFKAKCLRLIEEMQADGVPITITKRGKPAAIVSMPPDLRPAGSLIGCTKSALYRYDDPFAPAVDDWDVDAANPSKWDELL